MWLLDDCHTNQLLDERPLFITHFMKISSHRDQNLATKTLCPSFNSISKAPVSQLVNADDTSVIEIKTQHYLES